MNLELINTGKMRRHHDFSPDTPCSFSAETASRQNRTPHTAGTALGIDDEGDNFIRSATSDAGINLWLWVNQVRAL